jgi:hypothetical protein
MRDRPITCSELIIYTIHGQFEGESALPFQLLLPALLQSCSPLHSQAFDSSSNIAPKILFSELAVNTNRNQTYL